MDRRQALSIATLLVLVLAGWTQSGAEEIPQGVFTGEIKPVLYVADVRSSAAFYRDVLGFELLHWSSSEGRVFYAELAAADQKFGLHEPTSDRERERVGRQRLYFRVLDLAAHRRRVEQLGAGPSAVTETEWMDMFSVTDPDGHQITFAVTDVTRHAIDPW